MLKYSKTRNKFLYTVLPVFAIIFACSIYYYHSQLSQELRLKIESKATNLARYTAQNIAKNLNNYYYTLRTNANILSEFDQIDERYRRKIFDAYIKKIAIENKDIYAVWTIWEPNALDNLDKDNQNSNFGIQNLGAFASTWKNTKNGLAHNVAPIADYSDEYYTTPKNTLRDCLLNPYFFSYSDNPKDKVYETTIAVPIVKNGQFLGVVGMDISIQSLCDSIITVKPYENEGYALLVANNGDRIAHYSQELVGKKILGTGVYD